VDEKRSKFFHEETKEVGRRINRYTKAKRVTQEDIAKKCFPNVDSQLIYRRFAGLKELTIGEYIAICDYLEVPYDTFLEYDKYQDAMIEATGGRF
jgi:transcriptional regulator with XRE-family HTH domain